MSSLTYADITLDLVDTQGIKRDAVYSEDQTTYHWTLWDFDVVGIISPEATSYTADGTSRLGVSPITTDTFIRHQLMQPRQTLTFESGGETLLETPSFGYSTDAANGPIPISFDIIEVQGLTGLLVRFRIQARVNECTPTATRPMILSQRWTVSAEIDEDHFTTRIVRGIAVFRSDELLRQNRNVDQFRKDLFHPLGVNMRRENIHVDVLSDGNTVNYSFVDREHAYNLGVNSVATRLEAFHTASVNQPSLVNQAFNAAMGAPKVLGEIGLRVGHATASASGIDVFAGAAGIALATAGGLLSIQGYVADFLVSILPEYQQHVAVRAWGNRNASKRDLRKMVIGVAVKRIGGISALFASEAVYTEELTGKYVEFNLTHRYFNKAQQLGALALSAVPVAGFALVLPNVRNIFAPDGIQQALAYFDDSEELNDGSTVVSSPILPGNPPPPRSTGTRGTWVGDMVAEALQSPCGLPGVPRNSQNFDQTFR